MQGREVTPHEHEYFGFILQGKKVTISCNVFQRDIIRIRFHRNATKET